MFHIYIFVFILSTLLYKAKYMNVAVVFGSNEILKERENKFGLLFSTKPNFIPDKKIVKLYFFMIGNRIG